MLEAFGRTIGKYKLLPCPVGTFVNPSVNDPSKLKCMDCPAGRYLTAVVVMACTYNPFVCTDLKYIMENLPHGSQHRRPKQRVRAVCAAHILICSMFSIYYQIGKI